MSYDNLNYAASDFASSELEANIRDGEEYSQRCSSRLRAEADVVIGRGSSESGGLRGFFEAIKCAESFSHNYLQMMLLFISIEAVILLMTFISFVSGVPLVSYPAILLLCVTPVFFSVAAFSTFKPRAFTVRRATDLAAFSKMAAESIISPIIATVVYFALVVYLSLSGYIVDTAAMPLATTLGVIITFCLSFAGSMRECIGKKIDISDIKGFVYKEKSKNKIINVAAMTLVLTSVARMILTAIFIPSFSVEYGYSDICIETFILLAAYVVTFAMCTFIIRLAHKIQAKRKKHK